MIRVATFTSSRDSDTSPMPRVSLDEFYKRYWLIEATIEAIRFSVDLRDMAIEISTGYRCIIAANTVTPETRVTLTFLNVVHSTFKWSSESATKLDVDGGRPPSPQAGRTTIIGFEILERKQSQILQNMTPGDFSHAEIQTESVHLDIIYQALDIH